MDLDTYRGSAETFISELTGAYYRRYAGLELAYAIEPIYARHAELFTHDTVARLREQVECCPDAGVYSAISSSSSAFWAWRRFSA